MFSDIESRVFKPDFALKEQKRDFSENSNSKERSNVKMKKKKFRKVRNTQRRSKQSNPATFPKRSKRPAPRQTYVSPPTREKLDSRPRSPSERSETAHSPEASPSQSPGKVLRKIREQVIRSLTEKGVQTIGREIGALLLPKEEEAMRHLLEEAMRHLQPVLEPLPHRLWEFLMLILRSVFKI
ncbi:hypothetical protein [Thermogemmatispora sp.]|uniref:hypothetical protein n=1 Tax=Thermogemmatispora sp. TaxID=1968838 RepID=UPI0035E4278A